MNDADNIDDVDGNKNKDNEKEKQPKAKKNVEENVKTFLISFHGKTGASTVENGGPKNWHVPL